MSLMVRGGGTKDEPSKVAVIFFASSRETAGGPLSHAARAGAIAAVRMTASLRLTPVGSISTSPSNGTTEVFSLHHFWPPDKHAVLRHALCPPPYRMSGFKGDFRKPILGDFGLLTLVALCLIMAIRETEASSYRRADMSTVYKPHLLINYPCLLIN